MERIDWRDIISMMQFLVTSCNNFNPYVHPIYYSVRNKIKYQPHSEWASEYESLFQDTDVHKNPVGNALELLHASNKTRESSNSNTELPLYDSRSFCCNKPYTSSHDNEKTLFKNDFIKNIIKISYDPIGFVEVNKNILDRQSPEKQFNTTQNMPVPKTSFQSTDSQTVMDLIRHMALKNRYTEDLDDDTIHISSFM